ncbi:DNA replication licensing factor mcm8 [Boothiomyces macroporosus]|uniref:Ubiquinone biosynthesis monooxygenase COQ6, mitochondrial n=1 Tax=Boothiomyces macroporosus TaxID=261099 RepID=A0AAD5UK35_9FUNG|nr:DNA replication licensing factor mcm8 [Boothiomyces macroporosus]
MECPFPSWSYYIKDEYSPSHHLCQIINELIPVFDRYYENHSEQQLLSPYTYIDHSLVPIKITGDIIDAMGVSATFAALKHKYNQGLKVLIQGGHYQVNRVNQTTIDWQKIRIQEKLADDVVDSGRVPRQVECELSGDLVDGHVPGDIVTCSGIVKCLESEKTKETGQLYYLYIDVMHIKGKDEKEGKDSMRFSEKDLRGINEIYNYQGDLFKLLVHSVCPTVFGHEMVKAGILLTLFGARKRENNGVRSDPHMLIVGDPGLGKSQLLTASVKLAPRGVYVCGNATTTAGLTVTICKDSETGDTALEAGALVLGDQGVCCIDEFDKMKEHHALLEAMEQQSISVAKSGIVCSLPARTSIIAAANPVGGHYNKQKTVSENLKMNGALLSRFDLVFILLDVADENMDAFLSDHIMKIHSGTLTTGAKRVVQRQTESCSLLERLRIFSNEEIDPIPPSLLRKYISYARTYSKPKLTKEAAELLQNFYMQLRKKYNTTPITTRQLESMIRLSEARARSEMRDQVTAQDAQDVIDLMKTSLWDTYDDGRGVDFNRSQLGTGNSRQNEKKLFLIELNDVSRRNCTKKFHFDEMKRIANGMGLKISIVELVEYLNLQGISTFYDIAIVGGGMVGTATACAIASSPFAKELKIALIESGDLLQKPQLADNIFSNRVSSITPTSESFLRDLGAWELIPETRKRPYTEMHVWDGIGDGSISFTPENGHVATIVENRFIQSSLAEVSQRYSQIKLFNKEKVLSIKEEDRKPTLALESGETISCELLVGADGFMSKVRDYANIKVNGYDYSQFGLVATLNVEESDNVTAWQRFLPTGPIALLPLSSTVSSLVWSLSGSLAHKLAKMDPNEFAQLVNVGFLNRFQDFQYIIDNIDNDGKCSVDVYHEAQWGREDYHSKFYPPTVLSVQDNTRGAFPLRIRHADTYIADRIALVGDAAHSMHPLAGQGLNIGLSDAKQLAKVISNGLRDGSDLGSVLLLKEYESSRYLPNAGVMVGVDFMSKLFSTDVTSPVRSLGMNILDKSGLFKETIMKIVG